MSSKLSLDGAEIASTCSAFRASLSLVWFEQGGVILVTGAVRRVFAEPDRPSSAGSSGPREPKPPGGFASFVLTRFAVIL